MPGNLANGHMVDRSPVQERQVIAAIARDGEAQAREFDTFFIISMR